VTLFFKTEQLQAIGDSSQGIPVIAPCKYSQTWIEFVLTDEEGIPAAFEPFELRLPDQSFQKGTLNKDGRIRFEGIIAGSAKISFPNLDRQDWRTA
jgi:hypothetical protein